MTAHPERTVAQAPAWALQLVHDLIQAEELHPQYYVEHGTGYARAGCPITVPLERVPAEVRVAVELASRWQPEAPPEPPELPLLQEAGLEQASPPEHPGGPDGGSAAGAVSHQEPGPLSGHLSGVQLNVRPGPGQSAQDVGLRTAAMMRQQGLGVQRG